MTENFFNFSFIIPSVMAVRKVVIALIALLAVFTFLAIGINANQQGLISRYFREMSTTGAIFIKTLLIK